MKAVQDLSDPTGFSDGTRENGDKVSKSLAPNVAWRILLRICGMTPGIPFLQYWPCSVFLVLSVVPREGNLMVYSTNTPQNSNLHLQLLSA